MTTIKIAIINPPRLDKKSNYTAALTIPLGICYLASYLRENNIDVKIIDALGSDINKIRKYDDNFDYIGMEISEITKEISDCDVIGISANFSVQQRLLLEIIKKLRETFPEKIIVAGGNEATINYKLYLDNGVDYIVLGEGEETLLKLIKYLEKNRKPVMINGLAFYNKKKLVVNEKKYIDNLDKMPFPARDMLPLENYWSAKKSHGPVTRKFTSIITSRGCPYNCSFCSSSLFWSRMWRKRSIDSVIEEIEECINKYGITEFELEDDNLTLDKERAKELFRKIIEKGLKINWTTPNGVRSDHVDEEMLDLMKKSGCNHLTFAPESGSKRILKEIYNKSIDIDRIKILVKKCNKIGIKTACFFVVGTPPETKKDRKYTERYIIDLARCGLDEIGIFPCMPYPGTEIRKFYDMNSIREELIIGDIPDWYPNADEVSKFIKGLYIDFFVNKFLYHPKKFLSTIKNLITRKQELKMDRTIFSYIGF